MDTTEKILVVLVAMSGTFFVISLVAVCWGLRWRERAAEQYGIIEHYESSQGSFENQKWQANSRPEEELAVIPAASSSKQLPAPHHRELDAFSPHARQEQRRQRTAIVRQLLYMQFNASALYGSKKSVARRFFNRWLRFVVIKYPANGPMLAPNTATSVPLSNARAPAKPQAAVPRFPQTRPIEFYAPDAQLAPSSGTYSPNASPRLAAATKPRPLQYVHYSGSPAENAYEPQSSPPYLATSPTTFSQDVYAPGGANGPYPYPTGIRYLDRRPPSTHAHAHV